MAANEYELMSPDAGHRRLADPESFEEELYLDDQRGAPARPRQQGRFWSSRAAVALLAILGVVLVAFFAILALLVSSTSECKLTSDKEPSSEGGRPRNVVLMVSDGMGPSMVTLARHYLQHTQNKLDLRLPLDDILVGTVRTQSASSRITDSAAAATAYACGKKTTNLYTGVLPDKTHCRTLMEAAKERGMLTGLAVTSTVTHATPAAFTAHVANRNDEEDIALQQLAFGPDVMLGGGLKFFGGNLREDGVDALQKARDVGYTVVTTRQELEALATENTQPARVLGLFSGSHQAYNLDRPSSQPHLANSTRAALALLHTKAKAKPGGFVLLVEGSRIDMGAHNRDLGAVLSEVLAYQEAVRVVLDYARDNKDTLVVSTSDHETGGLSIGYQWTSAIPEYQWNPQPLANVVHSLEYLQATDPDILTTTSPDRVKAIVQTHLGITDLSEEEMKGLLGPAEQRSNMLWTLVPRRCGVGFTSPSHTGEDVNLYAYGPGSEHFRGNVENTDVGLRLASLLGLEL